MVKENLDNITCDEVEYDILDCFLPLLSLRHLPKILREQDKVVKYYETGVLTLLNAAQGLVYAPMIYKMFS